MQIEEKLAEAIGLSVDGLDLEVVDTTFSPADDDEVIFTRTGANEVTVSYIAHDDWDGPNFWEHADGLGKFQIFTNQTDRDAWIKEHSKGGNIVHIVDNYRHGNDHFSVAGTFPYPDRQWDVAPRAAFAPCDELQKQYRKAMRQAAKLTGPERQAAETAAMNSIIADSNSTLDTYSKWCNGETYMTVQETWIVSADGEMSQDDYDTCGDYIGSEYAMETLKGEIPEAYDPNRPETVI